MHMEWGLTITSIEVIFGIWTYDLHDRRQQPVNYHCAMAHPHGSKEDIMKFILDIMMQNLISNQYDI